MESNLADNLISVRALSIKLNLTPATIYSMIKSEKLRAYRIGGGRSLRIPADAVSELLATNKGVVKT
ncbi:helix-turn-helix domain-containing protein [Treponema primitia]|uniref:helix-turn-helix domain-containing protein n=1 Tax=Treponema primitia TaxID=88058 RepID=UPI00397FFE26